MIVTPSTALILLGFGVGALIVASRLDQQASTIPTTLRERADALRMRAREAQENSARASRIARDLMEKWSQAEEVAQRGER